MTLNELQKLIQLCRKTGVTSIKMEGVELTLTPDAPAPAKPRGKSAAAKAAPETHDKTELEDKLTDEQLLFYSVNYQNFLTEEDKQ